MNEATAVFAWLGIVRALCDAGLRARLEVRYQIPSEAIEDSADEVNAGLIAVDRRRGGLARSPLGSASKYVVDHAARPVFGAG